MELVITDIRNRLTRPFGSLDQFILECTPLPTSDILSHCYDDETIITWLTIMSDVCNFRQYDEKYKSMFLSFQRMIRKLVMDRNTNKPTTNNMICTIVDPGRLKSLHDLKHGMFKNRHHLQSLIAQSDISDPFSCILYNIQDHVIKIIHDTTLYDNCKDLYMSYMKEISSILI